MLKLFKGLKPFKVSVVMIIIFTLIQALSELFLPTLMANIVDIGIVNHDINYIIKVGIIMLGVASLGIAAALYTSYLGAKVGNGFARNLRNKIFKKVEGYSLNEFDEIGTASLITRTTNDVTQIQNAIIAMLRIFVRAPLMAVGGIIMAVSKNPSLSLVIIFVVIALGIIIAIVVTKSMPMFNARQVKLDKLNLVLRERLTGIRVIRAFNKIDHEKRRFEQSNRELTDISIKVNKIMAALMPIMSLLFNITSIAIIWFGSFKINAGIMPVGDLMAFIQYATQIMMSLLMLSMVFILIPRASASAVRINEVLNIQSNIKDPIIDNNKIVDVKEDNTNEKLRGYLEFKDVTFRYSNAEGPALENISFKSNPGEITAIIGGTGSGKSTLINLITRFYDVSSGSVLVDGVDVREISQAALRRKIGLVPQKAVLFTGNIIDNIRFGKEDASEQEVIHAAKIAQADEFVSSMADKYHSNIAQGGNNLSGGQKQRLSIARALVKKPEIYIFDDSFSALDFKTDAKLRNALNKEIKNDTVLIVAQRVTTVMNADRIIVLENGKIADIGTHKELLNSCEVYKQIVLSQLSEEELA
ncbi:ABC transporter ATP-binding protein [Abyssisolibacter fermentans]|uniref:ABC transporter ATP-binding protein n=1 Tax=Abyssisolibacter fermentans TaxID=1766203 RepID=UPI000832C4EA|nr:ABC transporter ATP-binding protein [Abyssisolibacter fermentans]